MCSRSTLQCAAYGRTPVDFAKSWQRADSGYLWSANAITYYAQCTNEFHRVSGRTYSFEHSVYGGFYRLCWCYVGCSSETAYAIDVGQVWLLGPSAADHHRTCISGRMCRVRDILGVGLSSADRAMLMDTCGSPTYVSGVVSAGMSNMFANATSFVWNVVTAHGGQYKLCWCTQNDAVALARTPVSPSFVTVPNCSDSTRFGQEFGRLYLLGPSHPDQSFTCVGGQTCQIRSLHDPHASIEDSLLLLDTCGSSVSYVPRSTMQPATTTQRDGQLVFEWHGVQTMQGGQYRLCWCTTRSGDGVNASALDLCEQPEHFLVDYGQLHVVGPSLNQIRTWWPVGHVTSEASKAWTCRQEICISFWTPVEPPAWFLSRRADSLNPPGIGVPMSPFVHPSQQAEEAIEFVGVAVAFHAALSKSSVLT